MTRIWDRATTTIKNATPSHSMEGPIPIDLCMNVAKGAIYAEARPKPETTRPAISPMRLAGNHFTAAGVAEAFADDFDWHAGLDEEGGVGMAKVVQSDPWEVELGEEPIERLGEEVGVDG